MKNVPWTREDVARIDAPGGKVSAGRRARRIFARILIRSFMCFYLAAMRIAERFGRKRSEDPPDGLGILLTATFYSDNWLLSHVQPIAASERCRRVLVVATRTVPSVPKVEAIYPPRWLVRIAGEVPARMMTFMAAALGRRPDVIGGFHLLLNGLEASFLARVLGARSLYFCGGGPTEVLGGGHLTENRLFRKLETPDPFVERCLVRAVGTFDHVIAMGSSTVSFFKERGVRTDFRIVPGGKDVRIYRPSDAPPSFDLVTVGRLSAVKRVDIFLQAVRLLSGRFPGLRAAVVGDGPLRAALEELARDLGIESNVSFAGHQPEVASWLRRSRIFVLTSDSEGLSLALMEAMMCGLAPVVSRVGDLADLVEDGANGYLVEERTPEGFAVPIGRMLEDSDRLNRIAGAARASSMRYDIENVAHVWDDILSSEGSDPSREIGESHFTIVRKASNL